MKTHLKFSALCTAFVLLASSCSYGQSSLLGDETTPKKSVQVTSSPSVSVSACKPVTVTNFKNIREFSVGTLSYSLLGVNFFPGHTVPVSVLESLTKDAFCVKEDPGVDDGAYVYLMSADNTLLNGKMIQEGYAKVAEEQDYVYKNYFLNLQKEAQTNKKGFWNPDYKEGAAVTNVPTSTKDGVTDLSKLGKTTEKDVATSDKVISTKEAHTLIFPQQAKANVGAVVVLRMKILSIGKSKDALYMNTQQEYGSTENVGVFISLPAKELSLQDVVKADKNLIGKYIEATGTLRNFDGKIQMEVSAGKDIRLVKMEK